MVTFNNCRISEDGKCLIVEVSVNSMSYFDNCYIEKIFIDTDETYSIDRISENAIEVDFNSDSVTVSEVNGMIKSVYINMRAKELNMETLNKNIFFIHVKAGGYPSPGCPCGMDNEYSLCYALNWKPLYESIMSYIGELADSCSIPKNLIDIFLRLHAIKMALKSGHFTQAIDLWQRWNIGTVNNITKIKRKCGCNGYN